MVKKPKGDDPAPEQQAVTPDQLTYRCLNLCFKPAACTLPTPWPPVPAASAQSASKR